MQSASTDIAERSDRHYRSTEGQRGPSASHPARIAGRVRLCAAGNAAVDCAALNISRAEVHGVFTFYHDYRDHPAGRHVLKLCRAEACQSMGGDALATRARQLLGVIGMARPLTVRSRLSRSIASAFVPAHLRQCSTARSSAGSMPKNSRKSRRRCGYDGHLLCSARFWRSCAWRRKSRQEIPGRNRQRAISMRRSSATVRAACIWLEPMVEVETPNGRVAYGPVKASDVAALLDNGMPRAGCIRSGSA